MAAEYSRNDLQTVNIDGNIVFNNGYRACKKRLISHRDDSGIFTLSGERNGCKAIYKVHFNANIAVSAGGTVGEISVALVQNGEVLRNAIATVTPTVAEAFFNVGFETFVDIDCGCCVSIAVENTSATAIDVQNANIVIDRVA